MGYFSSESTRDKLLLLYFLNSTGFELTREHISRIALENGWLDYFSLQLAFGELCEQGLINCASKNHGLCVSIAPNGVKALDEFSARLPKSLRNDIDQYTEKNSQTMRNSEQHISVITNVGDGTYMVRLKIIEGERVIFDLELPATNHETALTLCSRWEDRAQDVYSSTFSTLLLD